MDIFVRDRMDCFEKLPMDDFLALIQKHTLNEYNFYFDIKGKNYLKIWIEKLDRFVLR